MDGYERLSSALFRTIWPMTVVGQMETWSRSLACLNRLLQQNLPEADIADRQPPRLGETTLRAVSLGRAPPISVRTLRLRLRPYG
jgi:hypothetical protein